MFALFDRLVDEGKTLLVVTHDRDLSQQMRRVIHLVDGRIHRDLENSLD
jgi:putative ABC transport system ATP-binding protein